MFWAIPRSRVIRGKRKGSRPRGESNSEPIGDDKQKIHPTGGATGGKKIRPGNQRKGTL